MLRDSALLAALENFFEDILKPGAIFFLGAGASIPLVPTLRQLGDLVWDTTVALPMFDVERHEPGDFAQEIGLVERAQKAEAMQDVLRFVHTYEETLKAGYDLFMASAARAAANTPPSQYTFFRLLPADTIILTTNNDGLASKFTGLRVLELHGGIHDLRSEDGTIRRISTRQEEWLEQELAMAIEDAQDFGARIGPRPVIVRPAEAIDRRLLPVWERALRILDRCRVLVDIGYSLPRYDRPVRDLLWDATKRKGVTLWVASPEPRDVAAGFSELLSARSRCLPVRWDYLSSAIVRIARVHDAARLGEIRFRVPEIVEEYEHHRAAEIDDPRLVLPHKGVHVRRIPDWLLRAARLLT